MPLSLFLFLIPASLFLSFVPVPILLSFLSLSLSRSCLYPSLVLVSIPLSFLSLSLSRSCPCPYSLSLSISRSCPCVKVPNVCVTINISVGGYCSASRITYTQIEIKCDLKHREPTSIVLIFAFMHTFSPAQFVTCSSKIHPMQLHAIDCDVFAVVLLLVQQTTKIRYMKIQYRYAWTTLSNHQAFKGPQSRVPRC